MSTKPSSQFNILKHNCKFYEQWRINIGNNAPSLKELRHYCELLKAHDIPRLKDEFYQASITKSAKLGIPTCNELIEANAKFIEEMDNVAPETVRDAMPHTKNRSQLIGVANSLGLNRVEKLIKSR